MDAEGGGGFGERPAGRKICLQRRDQLRLAATIVLLKLAEQAQN